MTPQEVAQALLDIKAVNLSPVEPYTWSSGLKAPIYCDNRLIMSYPSVRRLIEDALAQLIKTNYPEVEVIAGTATAGISHAAFVAERLDLPMIYVRSSAKAHGRNQAIEGHLPPAAKVVMIEDLISTGGSVLQAAQKVQEAGGELLGAAAIFNYQLEKGTKAFQEAELSLVTLSHYQALLEVAGLDKDPSLTTWHTDPQAWSNKFGD